MFDDFMTAETLATFSGLVLAVSIIVQFTKGIVKKQYGDRAVRIYAFTISLVLNFAFVGDFDNLQGIIVTVINSILITLAGMGGYEVIVDPYAEKERLDI